MPIVVDEVVISVEVNNQASPQGGAKPIASDKQQDIVNQCVERVLDILEQREER